MVSRSTLSFAIVLLLSSVARADAPAALDRVCLTDTKTVVTHPGPFTPEQAAMVDRALGGAVAKEVEAAVDSSRWPRSFEFPDLAFPRFARLTMRRVADLGADRMLLVARAAENALGEADQRLSNDLFLVADARSVRPRPPPKGWPRGFEKQLAWLLDDVFSASPELSAADAPTRPFQVSVAYSEPMEGSATARRWLPRTEGPDDRKYVAWFGPHADQAVARAALDALTLRVGKVLAAKRGWSRVPDEEIAWAATASWSREPPGGMGGGGWMVNLDQTQVFHPDEVPVRGWWVSLALVGPGPRR